MHSGWIKGRGDQWRCRWHLSSVFTNADIAELPVREVEHAKRSLQRALRQAYVRFLQKSTNAFLPKGLLSDIDLPCMSKSEELGVNEEKPVALTLKVDQSTYVRLCTLGATERRTNQDILQHALREYLDRAGS
jgi:hypothetical protein